MVSSITEWLAQRAKWLYKKDAKKNIRVKQLAKAKNLQTKKWLAKQKPSIQEAQ